MRQLRLTNVKYDQSCPFIQVRGRAGIWMEVRLPLESMLFLNYDQVFLPIPLGFLATSTSAWFCEWPQDPVFIQVHPEADSPKEKGGEENSRVERCPWELKSGSDFYCFMNSIFPVETRRTADSRAPCKGARQARSLLVLLHYCYCLMRNRSDNRN